MLKQSSSTSQLWTCPLVETTQFQRSIRLAGWLLPNISIVGVVSPPPVGRFKTVAIVCSSAYSYVSITDTPTALTSNTGGLLTVLNFVMVPLCSFQPPGHLSR